MLAGCAIFGLSHEQYVTLLPKSITTAIGMGVSEELGGIVTITVAVIIITGVFGNMMAEFVCKVFRIQEPVAKGIAIGSVQWTIAITDTTVTITGANGNTLTHTQLENPTTGKKYDAYTYENTPVYALPSTGGTGIYLYMIGGMLLMGAAAWILYKNKCREVLGK